MSPVGFADVFPYRVFSVPRSGYAKIGRSSKSGAKNLVSAQDNGLIDSPVMSREHAKLHLVHTELFIEDVGSMHGTFVHDTRLSKNVLQKLEDGVVVRILFRSFLQDYVKTDRVDTTFAEKLNALHKKPALTNNTPALVEGKASPPASTTRGKSVEIVDVKMKRVVDLSVDKIAKKKNPVDLTNDLERAPSGAGPRVTYTGRPGKLPEIILSSQPPDWKQILGDAKEQIVQRLRDGQPKDVFVDPVGKKTKESAHAERDKASVLSHADDQTELRESEDHSPDCPISDRSRQPPSQEKNSADHPQVIADEAAGAHANVGAGNENDHSQKHPALSLSHVLIPHESSSSPSPSPSSNPREARRMQAEKDMPFAEASFDADAFVMKVRGSTGLTLARVPSGRAAVDAQASSPEAAKRDGEPASRRAAISAADSQTRSEAALPRLQSPWAQATPDPFRLECPSTEFPPSPTGFGEEQDLGPSSITLPPLPMSSIASPLLQDVTRPMPVQVRSEESSLPQMPTPGKELHLSDRWELLKQTANKLFLPHGQSSEPKNPAACEWSVPDRPSQVGLFGRSEKHEQTGVKGGAFGPDGLDANVAPPSRAPTYRRPLEKSVFDSDYSDLLHLDFPTFLMHSSPPSSPRQTSAGGESILAASTPKLTPAATPSTAHTPAGQSMPAPSTPTLTPAATPSTAHTTANKENTLRGIDSPDGHGKTSFPTPESLPSVSPYPSAVQKESTVRSLAGVNKRKATDEMPTSMGQDSNPFRIRRDNVFGMAATSGTGGDAQPMPSRSTSRFPTSDPKSVRSSGKGLDSSPSVVALPPRKRVRTTTASQSWLESGKKTAKMLTGAAVAGFSVFAYLAISNPDPI
ncbi:MAG: hypothetical protein M1826_006425 [Phylliscum demangeonii]|nr:MAG: hypothetical protein M1826_006425 [Phylliscum demangeonii]